MHTLSPTTFNITDNVPWILHSNRDISSDKERCYHLMAVQSSEEKLQCYSLCKKEIIKYSESQSERLRRTRENIRLWFSKMNILAKIWDKLKVDPLKQKLKSRQMFTSKLNKCLLSGDKSHHINLSSVKNVWIFQLQVPRNNTDNHGVKDPLTPNFNWLPIHSTLLPHVYQFYK